MASSLPIRSLIRFAAATCATLVCAFAQDRTPDPIERLVRNTARPLLAHADAEIAGEAALIVAGGRDPADFRALVAAAKNTARSVDLRPILALGCLGAPGTTPILAAILDGNTASEDERPAAAAFALTLLPANDVGTAIHQLLTVLQQGSPRRTHATTAALLLGLRRNPHPDLDHALRALWTERNRQLGDLGPQLLEVMARSELDDQPRWRERLLERGEPSHQMAVLRAYAGRTDRAPQATALLAKQSPRADVRAAALRLLIATRAATALDLSIGALASEDPDELQAAVHGVVSLGGAKFAATLEPHLLGQATDQRRAALLAAFTAAPSEALRDSCAAWAADRRQAPAVRRNAALLLARSQPERAAPLLRDLFVEETDPAAKRSLACALLAPGMTPPALDRLLPDTAHDGRLGDGWHALLAAGHPEAERRLLALLDDRQAPVDELRAGLRAWRLHTVLAVPPNDTQSLSSELGGILADQPSRTAR